MAELTGTLSNYITRVRRYLMETDSSTSFWTDAFLKQLFNTSYRRRCAQLHMAFEGFFVNVATRDIVANQARYAWPPGFQRENKLEIVRSDGTTLPLERQERHYSANQGTNSAAGGDLYNPSWRPIGSGFVLEPTPTTAVTGGLRIEYLGIPAELSADGDNLHPDFPVIFDELIVLDTACAAFDAEGIQEAPGAGMSRSLSRLRAEMELDWERWIDGRITASQAITPFHGHYEDA